MEAAALGVGQNQFALAPTQIAPAVTAVITEIITVTSQTVALCNGHIPTMEAVGRMSIPWPEVIIFPICVGPTGETTTAITAVRFSPPTGDVPEAERADGIFL
jgi:hypothetical protein